MDLLFLIRLIVSVVAIYVLLYSYGKIGERLCKSILSGLAGGFILFLAVNEILALPFILLHLSFYSFYLLFLLINIPLFAYGTYRVAKNIRLSPRVKRPSLLAAVALVTVGICTLITQFYVKYDGDDSYYVGLINQNIGNSHLYSSDPSTGNPELAFSPIYLFQGWELIQSSLTHTLLLAPVEFAHSLIPLLVIPLVFLVHKRIFSEFLRSKNQIYYALTILGVFFLFSGYSVYSQGTFLLTRVWQGKAILAALVIPLLLFALYKLYFETHNRQRLYFAILVINIASICINPAALFLNLAAVSIFGIMILLKNRDIKDLFALLLSSTPLIIAGIGTVIFARINSPIVEGTTSSRVGSTGFNYYLDRFIGDSWFLLIYIVGILLTVMLKKDTKTLLLFAVYPILLLATFLNPIFTEPVKGYVTSNSYWRFFWLIPITIFLPFICVKIVQLASDLFSQLKSSAAKQALTTAAYIIVAVGVAASGTFMFDTSKRFVAYDPSRSKVPQGVSEISQYMHGSDEGVVLAVTSASTYLHNFTTRHTLLVSRDLYLSIYYPKDSEQYKELNYLQDIVDEVETPALDYSFENLVSKYGVRYIIYKTDNQYLSRFTDLHKHPTIFSNNGYEIVQINQ